MWTAWFLLNWTVGCSALILRSFFLRELHEPKSAILLLPPLLLGQLDLWSLGLRWNADLHVELRMVELRVGGCGGDEGG